MPADFIAEFDKANAMGLNKIDEIVASTPFDTYDLRKYYTLHLSYELDEKKRESLDLFLQYISMK